MKTCPACGQLVIGLRKPRSTGWGSQNHHLNAHVQAIAGETGHDFDEIKVAVKVRAVKRGFPPPREIKVGGERWAVYKSEADCDTLECSYLIDEAHQLAAELSIVLREE